ncbi:MAG: phage portal protein [Magnetococcales bacterium]|nr:phage portal protein [Magnetococcales bacterium]
MGIFHRLLTSITGIKPGAITNYHGAFHGGSVVRRDMSGWRTRTGDADADTLTDLPKLRQRSRDLVRNAPLAGGAVSTQAMNVVGTGLALQSRVDRKALRLTDEAAGEWEGKVEREWRLFSESPECDITRTQNFRQLQDVIFRSMLESGDVFVALPMRSGTPTLPFSLRIQLIEADRVSNPNGQADSKQIAGGVERDAYGAPLAYHIRDIHPGSEVERGRSWQRIPAFGSQSGRRNLLHIFHRTRPGQSRGVPVLAPVITALKQLDRYTEAEMNAAVLAGMFAVFVKTPALEDFDPTGQQSETGATAADEDLKMTGGTMVNLAPGEDITSVAPGRPNQAFAQFVEAVQEQIGVGLGIPVELLRMHFSASYSASRAALLEAWKLFLTKRGWLVDSLCTPVYQTWMDEAVALGRIQAPGYFSDPGIRAAYQGAQWVGPAPGQLDPLKEANAAVVRIGAGLSSIDQEAAQMGGDFDQIHRQRAKEERMRQEAGLVMPLVAPDIQQGTGNG